MKKIILFVLLISPLATLFAQNDALPLPMDTLLTKKNEKLVGRITKIGETEVEYKKVANAEGPVYVISRDKLRELRFGNGTKELIRQEEMDINQELAIIDRRSAVKFQFFSPMNDQVTFAYEHSLKVGTNIELSAGLINNSMINGASKPNLIQGGLFKAGVKFLLGEDYYMKGMKYTHPLKGRFLKPEISYSSFIIRGLQSQTYYYPGGGSPPPPVYSNEKVNSVAITINYGRQFILGNILTLGYSIGLGYSFVNTHFTNSAYGNNTNLQIYSEVGPSNLYTHYNFSSLPIAYCGTITMGYIFK